MKQLVCEMCGSTEIMKQDGVFVCQSCGVKYSLEEAKKMFVEGKVSIDGSVDVTGSKVKIDQSDEINNILILARRARDNDNRIDADKFYEKALIQDPDSWEANFYHTYFSAIKRCDSEDIESVKFLFKTLEKGNTTIFDVVKTAGDNTQQEKILREICSVYRKLSVNLFNEIQENYDKIDKQLQKEKKDDMVKRAEVIRGFIFDLGEKVLLKFPNLLSDEVVELWDKGLKMNVVIHCRTSWSDDSRTTVYDIEKLYGKKVNELDESYECPSAPLFGKTTRV